jgi:hypothetical protein
MTDFVLPKTLFVLRTKLFVLVLCLSSSNEINDLQRTRTNRRVLLVRPRNREKAS